MMLTSALATAHLVRVEAVFFAPTEVLIFVYCLSPNSQGLSIFLAYIFKLLSPGSAKVIVYVSDIIMCPPKPTPKDDDG